MEIVKDVENKLMGRRELECFVENDSATLTRMQIKSAIAKKLKIDENLIIVKHISNTFGDSNIKIEARVYDSLEVLQKNARPHLIKRNSPKKENKGEE